MKNPACPWLPAAGEILDFTVTRRHGGDKGAEFYVDALRYAQSQWLAGKPAQAILQLNKAWMADLSADDPVFETHPSPFRALIWILENASTGACGYLGNPVRHFQHLASRMSGPRAEIRSWRAWLCFHLAEKILNPAEYPRDGEQIAREGLWIPSFQRARIEVACGGTPWTPSPSPPSETCPDTACHDDPRRTGTCPSPELWKRPVNLHLPDTADPPHDSRHD